MSGQDPHKGIGSAQDLGCETEGVRPDSEPAAAERLVTSDTADEVHGSGVPSPAREIAATTEAAQILFTRDRLDTTYVSGRRGMMVLSFEGNAYSLGRYDETAGEWRTVSRGWPRFGNALAFACSVVS